LYDFVDGIKGVEYRIPIAQQLVTNNVAVSMNPQRSELEHSMGEDSSSGVSSSNTSDSDSPAERGRRRRRGQGGRRGKWGGRNNAMSPTILQIRSAHADVQTLARKRSQRRGVGRGGRGRGV
jgi:hypothetical protein